MDNMAVKSWIIARGVDLMAMVEEGVSLLNVRSLARS